MNNPYICNDGEYYLFYEIYAIGEATAIVGNVSAVLELYGSSGQTVGAQQLVPLRHHPDSFRVISKARLVMVSG